MMINFFSLILWGGGGRRGGIVGIWCFLSVLLCTQFLVLGVGVYKIQGIYRVVYGDM